MATAVRYRIECEKEGATVKASYDLRLPPGDAALIAGFSLTVDGAELINQTQWVPGQSQFTGATFTKLEHPDDDATVTFSISTNEGWVAADQDTLRGPRQFDDVIFRNS